MIAELENAEPDGNGAPSGLDKLDGRLSDAIVLDMLPFIGLLLTHIGMRDRDGAHSFRTFDMLTAFGWASARESYKPKKKSLLRESLGLTDKCTPAARDRVVRCAALCCSFGEGRAMLKRLTGMDVSTAKVRAVALGQGGRCLMEQDKAARDVRLYNGRAPRKGAARTTRTLFAMLDGTNVNCTKADTEGIKGRNGGEAGTRQIRLALFGEYEWLDKKGRPAPYKESFSYAVSGGEIGEVTGLIRKLGLARGYGTAPRMQCVADGEEALETALRGAFPDAVFTNDFMHASGHLHTCCMNLGLPCAAAEKEYRFLKGLLFRVGAEPVIRRIESRHHAALKLSEVAAVELNYIRKRKGNMHYGKLRKEGFFIASGHVEAGARVVIVRRCKQAGMHWRHENAIRISAIVARLRSGTFNAA